MYMYLIQTYIYLYLEPQISNVASRFGIKSIREQDSCGVCLSESFHSPNRFLINDKI